MTTTQDRVAVEAENAALHAENRALKLLVEQLQGSMLRAALDAERMAEEHDQDLCARARVLRDQVATAGTLAFELGEAPAQCEAGQ